MHDPWTYKMVKWAVILTNLAVLVTIARPETHEDALGRTIYAVWGVESSHQLSPPDGDEGRAVGPLQVWPIRVEDCNRICRLHDWPYSFTLDDRRDLHKSVQMFTISCNHYWPAGTVEQWCRHWNGSPTTGPSDPGTLAYWAKAKAYLGE